MFFIKIYFKQSYMNDYHTSIQMCGQYCILVPILPQNNLNIIGFQLFLIRSKTRE